MLDATALRLLRSSFDSLKSRFQAVAAHSSPCKAVLYNHVDSRNGREPTLPKQNTQVDSLESLSSGLRMPRQEMRTADGTVIAHKDGFKRIHQFFNASVLNAILDDAGQLVITLPDEVRSQLWAMLPEGRVSTGSSSIWVDAVFELAWQCHSGSPLRALKFVQASEDVRIELGAYSLRRDSKTVEFGPQIDFETLGSNPDWHSTIEDFASASVQAVDIIACWLAKYSEQPESTSNCQVDAAFPTETRLAWPEYPYRAERFMVMHAARRSPTDSDDFSWIGFFLDGATASCDRLNGEPVAGSVVSIGSHAKTQMLYVFSEDEVSVLREAFPESAYVYDVRLADVEARLLMNGCEPNGRSAKSLVGLLAGILDKSNSLPAKIEIPSDLLTPGNNSEQRDSLLLWLSESDASDIGMPLIELPMTMREPSLLNVLHAKEHLIEFVRRNHCHVGAGKGELRLEAGWAIVANAANSDSPLAQDVLREALLDEVETPEIRVRVRLTRAGKIEASQIRLRQSAAARLTNEPPKPVEYVAETRLDGDDAGENDGKRASGKQAEAEFVFRPEGDGYFIRGCGNQGHVSANGAKGLHDLFRLVQTPGFPVPMKDFDAEPNAKRLDGDGRSRQPMADRKGLSQIAERRLQLKADIETAGSDMERDELQAELDKLEASAKAMIGIGGKVRDINNPLDKLRPKLLGRKATAIAKLRAAHLENLAEHFDFAVTSESGCMVYRPAGKVLTWIVTNL